MTLVAATSVPLSSPLVPQASRNLHPNRDIVVPIASVAISGAEDTAAPFPREPIDGCRAATDER
jgi:hypothetical protein